MLLARFPMLRFAGCAMLRLQGPGAAPLAAMSWRKKGRRRRRQRCTPLPPPLSSALPVGCTAVPLACWRLTGEATLINEEPWAWSPVVPSRHPCLDLGGGFRA